jgi:tripartite-type tricarboxylate transporter receptor subunit TctC
MLWMKTKAIVSAVALALAVNGAHAQAYPSRQIRVINPWAPGGPADIVARPIMQKLSEALGQPIVIENVSGANGVIGSTAVARAQPDGYTLLISHVGPMAISPAIRRDMPYDVLKDFEAITQFVSGPTVLVVRPDLPIRSLQDLISYAKASPGKLSYGSVGAGSTTHLAGELLHLKAGIDILHVPYRGAAPVITDLLGGQIDMAFINISGAVPYLQAGLLRGVAVSTPKRSSLLPDLPTVAETIADFDVNSWYGFMAPARTPKEIIERLHGEVVKIMRMPDIVEKMRQSGLDVEATTPEQHAAKIKSDLERWKEIVKAVDLN